MKRLLIIVNALTMGGAQMRILRTLEYLLEMDVSIDVVTFRTGPLEEQYTKLGANVIHLPLKGIFSQLVAVKALCRIIVSKNPGVVHTHLGAASLFGRLGAFIARRSGWNGKIITTHHGREKRRYHLLEKYISLINDEVICVSEHVRHEWITWSPSTVIKGSTVKNVHLNDQKALSIDKKNHIFVKEDKNKLFTANWKITIGFRGRLVKEKGPDILVDAFIELVRTIPGLRLIISGEGPMGKVLEKRVGSAGLSEMVTISSDFSIDEFYDSIDLFIMPSRTEGQGLSAMEAMSRCCLCMASETGGIPETVTHMVNGLLFKPDSVEALVWAVKRYLGMTESFRAGIIKRAYHYSALHTAEVMNKRIIGVYGFINFPARIRKILIVISSSVIGGGERHCLYLARHLIGKWNITVILSDRGPLYEEFMQMGVKPFCIGMRDNLDLLALYRMVTFIKKGNFDIVHSHLNRASLFSGIACRILKKPHISTVHGLNRKLYYSWSDRIIAVCRASKKLLTDQGILESKIGVIHNAVPDAFISRDKKAEFREQTTEQRDCFFGMIGKLHPNKGHETVLKAVSELKKQGISVVLEIAGTGSKSYRKTLEKTAVLLNIDECVHFIGFQEKPERLLKTWRALIIASYKEAFPYVALEAMGQKTLCIATRTGGIPELIECGSSGLLFEPGDVSALTFQMKKVLQRDFDYEQIVRNGQQRVLEHFMLHNAMEKIEKEYDRLLEK